MVINNNIQESYCSFELSKLLKEKGFDCLCHYHYSYGSEDEKADKNPNDLIYQGGFLNELGSNRTYRNSELAKWNLPHGEFSMPTYALAIEWLRVNFKIQLFLDYTYYDGFHYGYKWVKYNGDFGQYWKDNDGESPDGWDTPQQATEATLIYVLQNII